MSRPKRTDVFHLSPSDIKIEEGFNPRQDYGDMELLADSITQNGVKVPLKGFKKNGEYVLTDGHRRLKASMMVMEKYPEILIPFIVDKSGNSEEQRIIDVMICNDGKNLNPLEEAEVINRLINFGLKEREISKRTGK